MKERPILFSAPMVRALLDGSKTQTRRIYKNRKHPDAGCDMAASELVREAQHVIDRICPYGQPGDQLWVKETFCPVDDRENGGEFWYDYRATPRYEASHPAGWENNPNDELALKWKPSIFMPRKASRISLEITSVRVERLQAINRGDAMDEGCPFPNMAQGVDPRQWYAELWDSINGAGSWAASPWVWVVEFRRLA